MKAKTVTGIMMTMLLATTLLAFVPIRGSPGWDGEIHIAVVGPQGWIQWDGQWVGCVLARDLVNLGPNGVDNGGDGDDGIVIGGLNYKVVLQPVDSAAVPEPNPTQGWTNLKAALDAPFSADYVIGGFRTECVGPMRLNFIDYADNKNDTTGYAPIWYIAGASTDELIDCGGTGKCGGTCTRCNYGKGRYMFRNTPMNGTYLFKQLGLGIIRSYVLPSRLYPMYGSGSQGPVKTALVMEDLTWTYGMMFALAGNGTGALPGSVYFPTIPGVGPNPYYSPPSPYSVLGPQAQVVAVHRTHPLTPDFISVFNNIDAKNARLIIQIYSAVTGVDFITTYKDRNTNAVCVGINVESQMQEFWEEHDGKNEYETFLASLGTRTNISPDAEPLSTVELWDLYKLRSGAILTEFWGTTQPSTCPIYTMWGAYDTIISLDETLETQSSWPIKADTLIPLTEQTDRLGVLGKFKYTGPSGRYHDVYCHTECLTKSWPVGYVRSHITQWQEVGGEGTMVVVFPQDQDFSRRYRIPPWVYDLETDLTYDGLVDIDDVMIPALAFGAVPGMPIWNIEADFTADGLVDIDDVIVVALTFGDYHTPWPLPM